MTPETSQPSTALTDKQALLALRKLRARIEELERAASEPIAVIGVGCRFPGGADSPEALWSLLHNGVHAVSEVPRDRWDIDAFYDPDPDAPGKMYARHGAFITGVDLFDAQHFGMTPKEAAAMDPQHRLLLEVTWEALENAGCAPASLAGSETGVFIGISLNDYGQLVLKASEHEGFDGYVGTGNLLSAAAGRLSYVLGLHGPSMAVDTACSSSLVAVHLACQSLRNRECAQAVVGGVNLMLAPRVTVNCCRARMLARDGRCKTFDAGGDGYVRGEGCGVVILKRLSAALAGGDRILALLPGSAVNQDGRSSGFTAPNELAQQMVIRKALSVAGVSAADVGYVEAHGTGTSLGDPIEVHAIAAAYGDKRPGDRPMVVGSIKTNIGHLESAAGIAGLIKVILGLQHREFPPHLHFTRLNPHISLNGFPLVVPVEPTPWRSSGGARVAAVSSFGLSGTNAHVIVQEAPGAAERAAGLERPRHILALSARNDAALREMARRYEAYFSHPGGELSDICFTANAGRTHFDERLAVVGDSIDAIRSALADVASTRGRPDIRRGRVPKSGAPDVVFLFTGQGAQHVGMGRELYDTQPTFRRTLDKCDEILRGELERPLLSVLYPAPGEESLLNETAYTQPALFAIEYALAELWRSWGLTPAAVLGHSVGEYVAACVARVFSLEDALKLVAARGRLMQRLTRRGAMAAIAADVADVRNALKGYDNRVAIAAVNGPANTVISGEPGAVQEISQRLASAGVRTQALAVSHAFHSPLIDPMLDEFERVTAAIVPGPAQLTFASNLTGECVGPAFRFDAQYWRRHAREPVQFAAALVALHAQGYRAFVEVGPHPTLSALASQVIAGLDALWLPSLRRNVGEWSTLLDTLSQLYIAGASIDWPGFDRDYTRRKVSLPTYPFQRDRHWIDVPAPRPAEHAAGDSSVSTLYAPRWVDEPRANVLQDRSATSRHWLVLQADGCREAAEFSSRLAGEFEKAGGTCTVITATSFCADRRINFNDPETYHQLFAATGHAASGVVLLSDFSGPDTELHSGPLQPASVLCSRLSYVVRAVARSARSVPGQRIWVVTRGAQAAGPVAPLSVLQSPVWGLGRVAALEHPEIWGGLIDVSPSGYLADVPHVVEQMRTPDAEDHVAFRGGRRYVARLERTLPARTGPMRLSPDATYLVTGGFGSLGKRVAARLAARGARHIVLVGRSGVPSRDRWADSEETSEVGRRIATIRELERAGASVYPYATDVASSEQVNRLLADVQRRCPPIRGIVHAAGVPAPSLVEEITDDLLERAFEAKVGGAWRLHEAARDLPLHFFVLFSSIASAWGSKGVGAYAAANHFLDALASHRRARGLPAVSINWGPWADGGMVDAQGREWLAQMGVTAFGSSEALDILENVIETQDAQVIAARVEWRAFLPVFGARGRRPMFDRLVEESPERAGPDAGLSESVSTRLAELLPAQRRDEIVRLVRQQVAEVIGMTRPEQVDIEAGLFQMGMDSLMAVQLRHRLQRLFAMTVSPTLTFDHPSIIELATFFEEQLFGAVEVQRTVAPPAELTSARPADLASAVSALESMSDEQIEKLLSGCGPGGSR